MALRDRLSESQFNLQSFKTNRWAVIPTDGTQFDKLLERSYWTNVARKLRPCDIIEVHAADGSYFAELYVRSASSLEATVVVLRHQDLAAVEAPASDGPEYFVKYRNPAARFGVLRVSDRSVLKDGFQTAELAEGWLRDYRRSMAA